jgi:hypothetical protein
MAVNFTDLSTRLGKLFGYANKVQTQVSNFYNADLTSLLTEFDGSDYRDAVMPFLTAANPSTGFPSRIGANLYAPIQGAIQSLIINTLRLEADTYDGSYLTALRGLYDEMVSASQTFREVGTSSISVTAGGSNQGTGTMLARAYRPASSSVYLQEMFDETITARCTSPGTVLNYGSGGFSFTGPSAYLSTNTEWPGGSGVAATVSATPANLNSPTGTAGRNIIANGGFEGWSSNTPASWTITVGTAGTQVLRSTVYARGAYALNLVGNGSTLTTLRQQLSYSNSTPVAIQPNTDYAIVCYAKKLAGTVGEVRIGLRDASGTAPTGSSYVALALSSLSTSYALYSTTFSIAATNIPTTLYLDIYSTTALGSTASILIDEVMLVPMSRLYGTNGPSVLIVPGERDFAVGDKFTIGVTSTNTTNGKFMAGFKRWVQTEAQGVYLPVSATPSISDSLVTI